MKKIFFVMAMALAASGCGGSAREAAFLDGVKQYTVASGMLDEYEKYVDADPALKPDTKTIRKNTAKGLRTLIVEEEKALKK
jgi:hypothetical protein